MSNTQESSVIVDFVNLALNQTDRTGICSILEAVGKATRSAGVILWELDPDTPIDDPDARLFTAGHWFHTGKRFASHDLQVAHSLVGAVLQSHQIQISNNVERDPMCSRTEAALKFYKKHKIAKFHAAPVRFVDGPPGVLILFRQPGEPDFEPTEQPLLEKFCSLLPGVHDSLHHKVSLKLIDKVKDILQNAEDGPDDPTEVWQAICKEIQQCFHLVEASIFLEDPARESGAFRLVATTEKKYSLGRHVYRAGEIGKTSWVVTNQREIRIWDLRYRNDKNEKALIARLHPDLQWDDSINIEDAAAKVLNLPVRAIPPLSFIAEPILSGQRVLGVLRCCTIKEPPYYFTHRERALLAVIASQMGQFWSKWLVRRTMREENSSWNKLVKSISSLNYSVNSELRRQSPDILNVFRKALEVASETIPGGEITDIRMLDEGTDELYFALTRGEAWNEERKRIRFSASKKPPQSAGCQVYQTGLMTVIPDVHEHPYYKEIFADAHSMLIAPIKSANKTYGVMDIRNTGTEQFPEYAKQMAELLGQQLGLYHELVDKVSGLRTTEQQLKEQTKSNEQAFADWQHQIRGPINQAYLRLRDVMRNDFSAYDETPLYMRIERGLLSKARRASRSLRLFLDLAKGKSPRLTCRRLNRQEMVKLLTETCHDNRVLGYSRRNINFDVADESFQSLDDRELLADLEMIEQAVNNIVDNAFKYSYRHTTIRISASSVGRFFCLATSDQGIDFPREDLVNVGKRQWRGTQAESFVGEGSGIGLWVVSHIMKAHDGALVVLPTIQGRTEVRLLFPWK